MANPFNFSQGIQGKSNDQIYNEQLSRLGQNDLARAQGLNQLSERDLNTQIHGNRDKLAAALESMNPRQQEAARFGLSNPGQMAQIMVAAKDGDLQDNVLYGNQDMQNNAHAFNKSSAIYGQTNTGTRINNYDGSQRISDLDRQTANKKAFDMKAAKAKEGKHQYTIEDTIAMNSRYISSNEDGTSQPSAYLMNLANTQGLDIPPDALQFVHELVSTGMANNMPPAQIDMKVVQVLREGIKRDPTGNKGTLFDYFDSPSVSWSESSATGIKYALGEDGVVSGNDGRMYRQNPDGTVVEVTGQAAAQPQVQQASYSQPQAAAQPPQTAQPIQQQAMPTSNPQEVQQISQSMLDNPSAWAAGQAVNGTIQVVNKQLGRAFTIPYDAYKRMLGQPFASAVDQTAGAAKSFMGGLMQ